MTEIIGHDPQPAPAPAAERKIIHVDCDCFYAAVEVRDQPALRGRPVAVGGDPARRGVIATCNYEARRFAVHSAMPSAQALRHCPELIILRPDFDKYRRVSKQIRAVFQHFTPLIEPLSLDEAYLDVSASEAFDNSATRIAEAIRREVRDSVGITVSAGVAPNKFLAKIASDWRKPDGLLVIPPAAVADFVRQLPVEKIFGVGKVTAEKMHRLRLLTCGDLQQLSRLELGQRFGSFGERLWTLCRGDDDRPVRSHSRRKSISVETTFANDLASWPAWQAALAPLLEDLAQRFRQLDPLYRVQGRFIKVRYQDFSTATRELAISDTAATDFAALLHSQWQARQGAIRLLGVGFRLSHAADQRQADLFPEEQLAALQSERHQLG